MILILNPVTTVCLVFYRVHHLLLLVYSFKQCNQSCSEYQRIAHMNKLVPISAENAFGLDLELKTTTHWHNADIFADVKVFL